MLFLIRSFLMPYPYFLRRYLLQSLKSFYSNYCSFLLFMVYIQVFLPHVGFKRPGHNIMTGHTTQKTNTTKKTTHMIINLPCSNSPPTAIWDQGEYAVIKGHFSIQLALCFLMDALERTQRGRGTTEILFEVT